MSTVTVTIFVASAGRTKSRSSLSTLTSKTLKNNSGSVILSISARISCSEEGFRFFTENSKVTSPLSSITTPAGGVTRSQPTCPTLKSASPSAETVCPTVPAC